MLSLRLASRCAPRMLRHSATQPILRNGSMTSLISGSSNATAIAIPATKMMGGKKFGAGFSSSRQLNGQKKDNTAAAAASASDASSSSSPSGEVDEELVFKIDSEIRIEEDLKDDAQLPASVGDFLTHSPFTLEDKAGVEIVKLVRTYGEERITVSFSISDLDTNFDPYANDEALEDDVSEQVGSNKQNQLSSSSPSSQTAPTSRTGGKPNMQEEDPDMVEDQSDEEMSDDSPAPINITIVMEKPAKAPGALSINASARDGVIEVEGVSYLPDASLATSNSPDAIHKRVDLYAGPPFGSLDEDLQLLIERYLDERGINQAMAVFVADYVDAKEQREYVRWLENIRGFVDA